MDCTVPCSSWQKRSWAADTRPAIGGDGAAGSGTWDADGSAPRRAGSSTNLPWHAGYASPGGDKRQSGAGVEGTRDNERAAAEEAAHDNMLNQERTRPIKNAETNSKLAKLFCLWRANFFAFGHFAAHNIGVYYLNSVTYPSLDATLSIPEYFAL